MPEPEPDQEIVVDDKVIEPDGLTFGEQRKLRQIIRDLGGDPDAPADADFLPALVCVVKQQDDPEYTIDQALELKPKDVLRDKRPTRRPAKPRT